MTYRLHRALVASLSVIALMLAANDTSARPGGAARGVIATPHAFIGRHHHRNIGAFWPSVGDYGYGPTTDGGPYAAVTQPTYDAPRSTCTYDMPWDWAHRCPPAVAPSEKAYAPSCPTEVMKFPGRDGTEQTVNITRCY
jgi:hypothetical protein